MYVLCPREVDAYTTVYAGQGRECRLTRARDEICKVPFLLPSSLSILLVSALLLLWGGDVAESLFHPFLACNIFDCGPDPRAFV